MALGQVALSASVTIVLRMGVALTATQGLVLGAAPFAAACGANDSSPVAPTAPNTVLSGLIGASVTPLVVQPGETAVASVTGWTTPNGSPIYGQIPVTRWTSSNTSVATVASNGIVLAVGPPRRSPRRLRADFGPRR